MFLNFFSVYYAYLAHLSTAAAKVCLMVSHQYSRQIVENMINYENERFVLDRTAKGKDARQRSRHHEQC